jgi:dTDP-4-dehydrorhamnose reductase
MKILITGAGGMLGSDLARFFQGTFPTVGVGRRAAPHLSLPYFQQDLSDTEALEKLVAREKPDLIFHAAAMTNVDGCEREPERARKDNVEVTKNVVQASNRAGALLVFFSTDYVFDGSKDGEYEEQDIPRPLNIYGETKYQAEQTIRGEAKRFVIFRLSWLYGLHGRSFPRAILEKASQTDRLEVVSDQIGRPTYTADAARALFQLISRNKNILTTAAGEIFHLANEGITSWASFAETILHLAKKDHVKVEPIPSHELKRDARRPRNSVLCLKKSQEFLGLRLRSWKEAISDFIREFQEIEQLGPARRTGSG